MNLSGFRKAQKSKTTSVSNTGASSSVIEIKALNEKVMQIYQIQGYGSYTLENVPAVNLSMGDTLSIDLNNSLKFTPNNNTEEINLLLERIDYLEMLLKEKDEC